jgi:hypothetical protein
MSEPEAHGIAIEKHWTSNFRANGDLYCAGEPKDRSLDQGASVALPHLRLRPLCATQDSLEF